MKKLVPFILLIIGIGIVTYLHPPQGLGVILLIPFHELGHYTIAKYYKNYDGFCLDRGNPGVRLKTSPKTLQERCFIDMSGFLFSIIIFPIIFCIGGTSYDIFILLACGVVGSFSDFSHVLHFWKTKKLKEQLKHINGES